MEQTLLQTFKRTLVRTGCVASCLLAVMLHARAQTTTIIGTGTSSANTYGPARVNTSPASSTSTKVVTLYTQSELAAAGIYPGSQISAIAWQKSTAGVLSAGTSLTINVSMRSQVAATTYGPNNIVTASGTMDSYIGTNFPVVNGSRTYNTTTNFTADTTWESVTLTNPFTYTGGSMEIYTNTPLVAGTGSLSTINVTWRFSTLPSYSTATRTMYSNNAAAYNGTANANIGSYRPNIKLTFTPPAACTGTPVAGTLHLDTAAACPGMIRGNLGLTGMSTAPGVTFLWQKRTISQPAFSNVTGTTPYTLENESVTDTTLYRVVATCSAGGTADTSNVLTLYPAQYIAPTYHENFNTTASWGSSTPPDCWYGRNAYLGNPISWNYYTGTYNYNTGSWGSDGWRNNGTIGAARIRLYGGAGRVSDWLVSPGFQLDNNHWQLEFDLGVFTYNAATRGFLDSNDVFAVVISTDGGLTWTTGASNQFVLKQFTAADSLADSTHVTIPLNTYSGSRIAIGLFCDGGLTQPTNSNLIPKIMIDNFKIVPRCKTRQADSINGTMALCPGTATAYTATTSSSDIDSLTWLLPQGWTGSSNSDTIAVTAGATGGQVQVVTYGSSCDPSDTLSVTVDVYAKPLPVIQNNNNVLSTTQPFASYQWYKDGQIISGATAATYTFTVSGSYTVAVTDTNGCANTADTIQGTITEMAVNGANVIASQIHLYPNPATSQVTLERSGNTAGDDWQIVVNDVAGKNLQQLKMSGAKQTIDLSKLRAGIYFLQIKGRQGCHTEKIVKQ